MIGPPAPHGEAGGGHESRMRRDQPVNSNVGVARPGQMLRGHLPCAPERTQAIYPNRENTVDEDLDGPMACPLRLTVAGLLALNGFE